MAKSKSIIAVRDGSAQDPYAGMNFFERLWVSFERNIIEEERYMLIWDGLVATFTIAICSVLFGTLVGAVVCYLPDGTEKAVDCDGVFVSIGRQPATELFHELEKDEGGYMLADESTKTSLPGVFAAGDVRSKVLRQVITAAADGAVAAHFAEEYLSLNA